MFVGSTYKYTDECSPSCTLSVPSSVALAPCILSKLVGTDSDAMSFLSLPSLRPRCSSRSSSYSSASSTHFSDDSFQLSSSPASSVHASDDEEDCTALVGDCSFEEEELSDFDILLRQFRSIISNDADECEDLSRLPNCVPQRLQHVMRSYRSSEEHWTRYAYLPTEDGDCRPFDERDTEAAAAASSQAPGWKERMVCHTGGYTRNLVDAGNGLYNVLVLCWPSGSGSKIHDHPGSHCIVRTLPPTRITQARFN